MTKLSGAQLRKMFLGTDKEEYLKFEDSTLIPNLKGHFNNVKSQFAFATTVIKLRIR